MNFHSLCRHVSDYIDNDNYGLDFKVGNDLFPGDRNEIEHSLF